MSSTLSINDLLVKPVYDVGFEGEDKIIPLGTDTLALQSITWSSLSELLQPVPGTGADANIEDYPRLVSDVDALGIENLGDGVPFDRIYEWVSDMSIFIYKFFISFAVGLSVTAFTSGNHSIDSVRLIITERGVDGTLIQEIADLTKDTGMTNIVAINDAVAIMQFVGTKPFKISQGNRLRFRIILNSTDTDVATSFEGIMPLFFFQEGALTKTLAESSIILHMHPALDQAFPVFRDESIAEGMDYSGVTKEKQNRSALQ